LKEISEQPDTIFKAGENVKNAIQKAADQTKSSNNIYITGSGTSYNAALIAKQLFLKYVKIKIETIISSELQFSSYVVEPNSTLITISQSGESADVLEAVNIAKQKNCKIISIVNSLTSSLTRESNLIVDMNCGPEIGVAATKSFTSKVIILYKILEKLTKENFDINFKEIFDSI